jgi:hypothetical protein
LAIEIPLLTIYSFPERIWISCPVRSSILSQAQLGRKRSGEARSQDIVALRIFSGQRIRLSGKSSSIEKDCELGNSDRMMIQLAQSAMAA